MAQLVERLHGMEEVAGSNPAGSTKSFQLSGLKFTWLNTAFALQRQAVRVRPGPPLEPLNQFLLQLLQPISSRGGNCQNFKLFRLEKFLRFFDFIFTNQISFSKQY